MFKKNSQQLMSFWYLKNNISHFYVKKDENKGNDFSIFLDKIFQKNAEREAGIHSCQSSLQYSQLMTTAGSSIAPKDEPATTAKVVLLTTNGEIQIDIWGRETPLAARNFIQLCLEDYYNNTIFHRMIPGFMIQGGDPTGTGTGGDSIYGQPFKDEFHQRLKFGRRGMVAMANSGKDANRSQFFITFGECPHLNKKHTIFGKVVGDSIFNLLSFQSLDTDDNDRPSDPPYIRKTKVILNPFDDIIPRKGLTQGKQPIKDQNLVSEKQKKNKTDLKKLKNKKKLTFDDEEEEETGAKSYKMQSSHDALNDQRLSKQAAIKSEDLERRRQEKLEKELKKQQVINKVNQEVPEDEPQGIAQKLQAEILKKKKAADSVKNTVQDEVLDYKRVLNSKTGRMELVWGQEPIKQQRQEEEDQKMKKLRQLQEQQYQAMRVDELNFKRLKEGSMKEKRRMLVAEQKTLLSNVERRKYEFLKKSKIQKQESEIFSKLAKFTGRLQDDKKNDWMCHRLKFHIDSENAYNLDRKNQQRKARAELDDDGGLKVEFSKAEQQGELDLEELYELAKGE